MKKIFLALGLICLISNGCAMPSVVHVRVNTVNPPVLNLYPEIQFEYEILR